MSIILSRFLFIGVIGALVFGVIEFHDAAAIAYLKSVKSTAEEVWPAIKTIWNRYLSRPTELSQQMIVSKTDL